MLRKCKLLRRVLNSLHLNGQAARLRDYFTLHRCFYIVHLIIHLIIHRTRSKAFRKNVQKFLTFRLFKLCTDNQMDVALSNVIGRY